MLYILKISISSQLLQYRVALSGCWIFCFYGVVGVAYDRKLLVRTPLGKHCDAKAVKVSDAEPGKEARGGRGLFALASFALLCQAAVTASATVLWPIIAASDFGWSSVQYSYCVIAAAVGRVAVGGVSTPIERRLGRVRSAIAMTCAAGASAASIVGLTKIVGNSFSILHTVSPGVDSFKRKGPPGMTERE